MKSSVPASVFDNVHDAASLYRESAPSTYYFALTRIARVASSSTGLGMK